jgi:DNA-binding LacI/PurR family transcriptional regulator
MNPKNSGGYACVIVENDVDGVFPTGSRQNDTSLMSQWFETDIPFVDVSVTAGATLAVIYLMEWEHQHIGIITNVPLIAEQRRNGYRKAPQKANLPASKIFIKEVNDKLTRGFEAMRSLLQWSSSLTTTSLPAFYLGWTGGECLSV